MIREAEPVKIRSRTIVCPTPHDAVALADEYAYIGIRTTRRGRFLTITTREEG